MTTHDWSWKRKLFCKMASFGGFSFEILDEMFVESGINYTEKHPQDMAHFKLDLAPILERAKELDVKHVRRLRRL